MGKNGTAETWAAAADTDFYHLQHVASGLCLMAEDASQVTGRVAQARPMLSNVAPDLYRWTLTPDGLLVNKAARQVLDVRGNLAVGTYLMLTTAAGADSDRRSQQWVRTADGRIQSRLASNLVMGLVSLASPGSALLLAKTTTPTPLQTWRLVKEIAQEPALFVVEHVRTGGRLTPAGGVAQAGTAIAVEPISVPYPRAQLWNFSGHGLVINSDSGLVAAARSGTADVVLTSVDDGASGLPSTQRWTYRPDGTIASAASPGSVLGLADPAGTGGQVRLVPPQGSADQQWRVRRAITPEPVTLARATVFEANRRSATVGQLLPVLADLTCEAWVRTTSGGPVIASTGVNTDRSRLLLGLNRDGRLVFQTTGIGTGGQPVTSELITAATSAADGGWHHLAGTRRAGELTVYLDGSAVPAQQQVTPPPGMAAPVNPQQLLFGFSPLAAPLAMDWLTGEAAELRVWRRARTDVEIATGMHHRVDDTDPDLLGHWTFAGDTGQDRSLYRRDVGFRNQDPKFVDSDVEMVAAGEFYLVTQARLTEDYITDAEADTHTAIEGYRVSLSIRDGNDQPAVGFVTLALNNPQVSPSATLHFTSGTSSTLDGGHPLIHCATDIQGTVSFSMDAAHDLACPTLRVQADFMTDGSWLVVAPDRQVHAAVAAITGNALRGRDANGNPLPGRTAPLPDHVDADTASSLATALNQVMTSAVAPDTMGSLPQVRQLDDLVPALTIRPYLPRFQRAGLIANGHDATTDVIGTHWVDRDIAVARIVNPSRAAHPHWAFDSGFTAHSVREAANELDNLKSLTAVGDLATQLIPHFSSRMLTGATAVRVTSTEFNQAARADIAGTAALSSWLSDHVAAARRVLSNLVQIAVVDEVSKVERTISQLVVTAIDDLGRGYFALVQTVEHAVAVAGGLLQRLGADISRLVSFLKDLFDWDDVLSAHRVTQTYLLNLQPLITEVLASAGRHATQDLEKIRADLDHKINEWKADMGSGGSRNMLRDSATAPPANIKGSYLTNMTTAGLGRLTSTSAAGTGRAHADSTLEGDVAGLAQDWLEAIADTWEDFPQRILDTPLASVHTVETFLRDGISLLLSTLESLLDTAFLCLEQLLDDLIKRIEAIVAGLFRMATEELKIPLITSFYEKVIMQGNGEKLTVLGLSTLLAAAAGTFAYKLTHDNHPPITQAEADAFMALRPDQYTWLVNPFAPRQHDAGARATPTGAQMASFFLAMGGSAITGIINPFNDGRFAEQLTSMAPSPYPNLALQMKYHLFNSDDPSVVIPSVILTMGNFIALGSSIASMCDAAPDPANLGITAAGLIASGLMTSSTIAASAKDKEWARPDTFLQPICGILSLIPAAIAYHGSDRSPADVSELVLGLAPAAYGTAQGCKIGAIYTEGVPQKVASLLMLSFDVISWTMAWFGGLLALLTTSEFSTGAEYLDRYAPALERDVAR
jgi:hypothetical protein